VLRLVRGLPLEEVLDGLVGGLAIQWLQYVGFNFLNSKLLDLLVDVVVDGVIVKAASVLN